jgi:probable F420-dependent oxidoreductase
VKFGIILSHLARFDVPVAEWIPLASHCEELGYGSVWVHDHLATPVGVPGVDALRSAGSGPEDRRRDPGSSSAPPPSYEALTLVSALAAGTQRVQIGTCVLVLPLRHPAVTAKMLATADLVANGRIVLGVGTGQVREEFAALGLPGSHFEHRGEVTDEYLRAIKEMWLSTGPSNFTGTYVSFADVGTFPKPLQRPHPRIVVGGDGLRAMRRASRHGNGYLCTSLSPAQLEQRVAQLRDICRRDWRDPDEVEVHLLARVQVADRPIDGDRQPLTGSAEQIWADLGAYGRSGLDHLVLWPGLAGHPDTFDSATHAIDTLATEILPAFAVRS